MLKQAFLYGLAGVIAQLFQYFTLPFMAGNLSPDQFGIVSILESMMFLAMILLAFSVERGAQRFYFDTSLSDKHVFLNAQIWLTGSSILFLAIVVALEFLGFNTFAAMPPWSIPMMVLAAWAGGICGLASVYFQVEQKPIFFICLNLIKGVVLFALTYFTIQVGDKGVYGFIISITVANLLAALFGLILLPKIVVSKIDIFLIRDMLRFSAPFVPTVLGAWLLTMGGRFFLQKYSSIEDVGLYSFWYKISLAFLMCSAAINSTITPVIYRYLSRNPDGTALSCNFIKPLIKIYSLGGISFILISGELADLMGGTAYQLSPVIFSLLILGHFCSLVMGGGSDLLLSYFRLTKAQMVVFLAGGSLSIMLNIILTPRLGVTGVVLASVTGLVFIVCSHWAVLKRNSLPTLPIRDVASWGAATLITGLVVNYVGQGIRMLSALVLVAIALTTLRNIKFSNDHSSTSTVT